MKTTKSRIVKTSTLVLLIATLLFVTACSQNGGSGNDNNGTSDGIVLKVFGPSAEDIMAPTLPNAEEVGEEIIQGFLAENPDIARVDWDAQGSLEQGTTRLMTATLGGQEIDLIRCAANSTNSAFIGRNVVRPLSDEDVAPFIDRIDPAALDVYSRDGILYGIPIAEHGTTTFYYNKDIFANLGLNEPSTYEELVSIAETLQEEGITPVLHQGLDTFMWPIWYFETFSQTAGDSIEKTISNLRGETKFTDAPDVEALERLAQFVKDGVLDITSLSTDRDGMRSAFLNGDAAMYYNGTWELAFLNDAVEDFELGVFEFPQLANVPGTPGHGGGAGTGICISNTIKEEKLPYALKFIEYVTRPEIGEKYLTPLNPFATSIEGVPTVESPINNALQQNHVPNTVKFLDWIWPIEVNDAYQSAIQGVIGGTITGEEAAQQVQRAFDSLVSNGYEFE